MLVGRGVVEQDHMIKCIQELFRCRVLWSEGRPCLEYDTQEELDKIADYMMDQFDTELLDLFFTAIESLPEED